MATDISGVFTFEDSLLMNVFDLNLTKNCNIILCTFSLYSVNKLSCKQIKYLSYLFTLPSWYCNNVYSDNSSETAITISIVQQPVEDLDS